MNLDFLFPHWTVTHINSGGFLKPYLSLTGEGCWSNYKDDVRLLDHPLGTICSTETPKNGQEFFCNFPKTATHDPSPFKKSKWIIKIRIKKRPKEAAIHEKCILNLHVDVIKPRKISPGLHRFLHARLSKMLANISKQYNESQNKKHGHMKSDRTNLIACIVPCKCYTLALNRSHFLQLLNHLRNEILHY